MRRRLLALAIGACLTAALPSPAAAQFDIGGIIRGAQNAKKLGDSLRKVSEAEEITIGGDLASLILGTAPLIDDPAKQRYINRMGRWLAVHSDRPDLPWKFGIVESGDVNAFSMPGGYVLVTRGMFDRMRTESELAAVLSHEIAHVAQKDHLGALQQSLRNSALSGFTEYVGGGGGLTGAFRTALINAGKDMFARGLSKDDEFDADRIGVVIAARSGYSPYGMVGVLQTLSAAPDDKGFALHNRTHPLPVERLDRLDRAMGTRLDALPGLVEDVPGFVALRAPPPPPKTAPTPPPPRRRGRR